MGGGVRPAFARVERPGQGAVGGCPQDLEAPGACVRSAFDLPPEQHAAIQKALNETFSADIHIQFETAPEVVSGIELSVNGQKVAWSIADYLAALEKSAGELLHAGCQARLKTGCRFKASFESRSQAWTEARSS